MLNIKKYIEINNSFTIKYHEEVILTMNNIGTQFILIDIVITIKMNWVPILFILIVITISILLVGFVKSFLFPDQAGEIDLKSQHKRYPATTDTSFSVYNLLGQTIKSLPDSIWDGRDKNNLEIPIGAFFYKNHKNNRVGKVYKVDSDTLILSMEGN